VTTFNVIRYILIVPSVLIVGILLMLLILLPSIVFLKPNSTYWDGFLILLPFNIAFDLLAPIVLIGFACFICPSKRHTSVAVITLCLCLFVGLGTVRELLSPDPVKPQIAYILDLLLQWVAAVGVYKYLTRRRVEEVEIEA
jgi:hypothetical protein